MRPLAPVPSRILVLLVLFPVSAEPWGFTAHRRITAAAVARLPEPLRSFFRVNARTIAEHSVDPDLWRSAGNEAEGPNHYINIDAVSSFPFEDVPLDEQAFLRRFGEAGRAAGRLPWRVGEVAESLSRAFRAQDGKAIRQEAAVLAHYLGDLHVPLHLARNHDGQETDQDGIHRRWESELVDRYVEQIRWRGSEAKLDGPGDPVAFAFQALRRSYPGVQSLLLSDRETVAGAVDFFETPYDDRYGPAYFSKLFGRERERLTGAISAAIDAVARLWLGAWERAGRPALPGSPRDRFVRGEARAILMSWDGAAEFMVEKLLADGKLPNLARLAAQGTSFDYALSTFPTKTASAHAAMYTGTTGEVNGISGNQLPYQASWEHTALDFLSGYPSTSLRAEPLWVTAARQGLKAVSLHSTQTHPFEPFLSGKRFGGDFGRNLLLFFGYERPELMDEVYRSSGLLLRPASGWKRLPPHHGRLLEFRLEVWGTPVHALLLDTAADPKPGFDRMLIGLSKEEGAGRLLLAAHPAGSAEALETGSLLLQRGPKLGSVFFRLFELAPDGSNFLLYRSKLYHERISRPELEEPYLEAVGGFQGNDASILYEKGAFGQTVIQGGSGLAEARYMDILHHIYRQFTRETDFVLTRTDWDLLFHYLPFPDDTAHLWYGWIDPKLASYNPAVGEKLRPLLEEVYGLNDRLLGLILERAPANTVFALTSDHGFAGTDRAVYPNVALRKAGLLSLDGSGGIDIRRSRVFYHPADSAYLLVNTSDYRDGVVLPEEKASVLEAARTALEAVVEPKTGQALFTGFFDPGQDEGRLGIGGRWGGDLYLDIDYGYRFEPEAEGEEVVRDVHPDGTHIFLPTRPEMRAILYLAGPGVRKGERAGPARLIDIASTLSHLLGIDPPRQSRGRILEEAIRPEP